MGFSRHPIHFLLMTPIYLILVIVYFGYRIRGDAEDIAMKNASFLLGAGGKLLAVIFVVGLIGYSIIDSFL